MLNTDSEYFKQTKAKPWNKKRKKAHMNIILAHTPAGLLPGSEHQELEENWSFNLKSSYGRVEIIGGLLEQMAEQGWSLILRTQLAFQVN